jgi:serine phosphatase RsbU (regulator of sigma subunit)
MANKIGHILIVDDNPVNSMILVRALQKQGHITATAENGREALDRLHKEKFDVVLLDILMPVMDGYQTLAAIQQDNLLRHIPVIMISALDEMESVIRCIEMGAADYLPKPFNPHLLRARVSASLDKKILHDQEQLYLHALERELEIGREIQSGFLPETLPQIPGWEIAEGFRAARVVSGDFYDAFILSHPVRLGIVIADVSGKGVGAALFMALFRTLIRALGERDYEEDADAIDEDDETRLRRIVGMTNNYVARTHFKADMFATVFVGLVDPANGRMSFVNAGHNPPLVTGRDGGIRARLDRTTTAIGILPNINVVSNRTTLAPGDLVVAYTDGVTEANDRNGNLFTEARLQALVQSPASSARAMLDRIESALGEFTAHAEQSDDITMIAVRRQT